MTYAGKFAVSELAFAIIRGDISACRTLPIPVYTYYEDAALLAAQYNASDILRVITARASGQRRFTVSRDTVPVLINMDAVFAAAAANECIHAMRVARELGARHCARMLANARTATIAHEIWNCADINRERIVPNEVLITAAARNAPDVCGVAIIHGATDIECALITTLNCRATAANAYLCWFAARNQCAIDTRAVLIAAIKCVDAEIRGATIGFITAAWAINPPCFEDLCARTLSPRTEEFCNAIRRIAAHIAAPFDPARLLVASARTGNTTACHVARSWGADNFFEMLAVSRHMRIAELARTWIEESVANMRSPWSCDELTC
jgi:hypothetical protein